MKNIDTFSTIENTQEFLSLLSQTIDEVLDDARCELSASTALKQWEDVEVWQLVLYTTTKLSSHIANSRKLMSDLDTLKKALDQNNAVREMEQIEAAEFYAASETETTMELQLVEV